MNSEFSYVDANYSYVDVARSSDRLTTSAIPSSYYVQTPMENNLLAPTCNFSNFQHAYSNSHASATLAVHMPMNNMMNLVNQYETPNVINFDIMQNSVSPFYSSANNLQYFGSPSHMPMDRAIGDSTTRYLANYSQSSYTTPYVTNFSAPYATLDVHNSATDLHTACSRISENSIGAHVASSDTVACDTSPKKLQNFGNTQVSLPKNIERSKGQSSKEWVEDLAKEVLEAIAMRANQRKKLDSISTANSAKAGLNNTCGESNQQEKNIAEPSSVEKKEDNKLENHQEVEQDIVQVVQPSYSLNLIDLDNKKMLIRSDQTGSARGKNVFLDDIAHPRMIE
jgi:hypothetical protein